MTFLNPSLAAQPREEYSDLAGYLLAFSVYTIHNRIRIPYNCIELISLGWYILRLLSV